MFHEYFGVVQYLLKKQGQFKTGQDKICSLPLQFQGICRKLKLNNHFF